MILKKISNGMGLISLLVCYLYYMKNMNLLYFIGKNCSAGEKIIKGLNTFPDLKIEVLPLLEDLEHYWQQKE